MHQIGFVQPSYLWFLLATVPVLTLVMHAERERKRRLANYGRGDGPRKGVFLLPVLISIILPLSLARPYLGAQDIDLPSRGRDILVLFDISTSMYTRDVSPNRFEVARRKLIDFVSLVEANGAGDRIGIVPFAGTAFLFSPLTEDYEALRVFIQSLTPKLISAPGSALNDAVQLALRSFEATKSNQPTLLLISDGEDQYFNQQSALESLKRIHSTLFVLGIGTPEGKPIELSNGRFIKDERGDVVVSKLYEQSLMLLAKEAGGIYARVTIDDKDLETFLSQAKASGPGLGSRKVTVYNEWGPFLALFALLLLCAPTLMRHPGYLVVALLVAGVARAEDTLNPPADGTPRRAYQAYQDKDYDKALSIFDTEQMKTPEDQKIKSGRASTLYRLGRYKEASSSFDELSAVASNPRSQFEALYNGGNAHFMDKDYQGAIERYEQALKLRPDEEKTIFNRDLAKKMLEQKQEEQKKEDKQDKNEQEKNKEEEQQEKNQQQENQQNQDQQQNQEQSSQSSSQGSKGNSDTKEEDQKNDQTQEDAKDGQTDSSSSASSSSSQGKEEGKEPKGTPTNENNGSGDSSSSSSSSSGSQHKNATEAATKDDKGEAKAWLESLPDSPLLLRQHQKRGDKLKSQSW